MTKDNIFNRVFKWEFNQFIKALIGVFLFAFAVNVFIVPMGLYNGGALGISQLIRTFLIRVFHLHFNFDFAGLLYYILNVPLFILAYKYVSKTFFARTLLCVSLETLFLTIIQPLSTPLVAEKITSVLIGGIIAGIGSGMTLSAGASGGGTDIIGVVATLKNRNFSVGKLELGINAVIYTLCGILSGLSTMIYSIIYSVCASFTIDNTHAQNICSTAIIFTKKKPTKISEFVVNELDRDITTWEAVGGYKNTKTYISYIAVSKYELQRLERNIKNLDESAFLVKTNGVEIDGNFRKRL